MTKTSGKYWENETPAVTQLGINEFREYREAGKVQVYRIKEGSKYGVTKGCTIELDQMSEEELIRLKETLVRAIEFELAQRGMGDIEEPDEEVEKPKKEKKKKKVKKVN